MGHEAMTNTAMRAVSGSQHRKIGAMKALITWFARSLLCLMLASMSANGTVLIFEGFSANDYDPIPQGYGDNVTAVSDGNGDYEQGNGFTPNVQASYRTLQDYGNSSQTWPSLAYWRKDYGDLRDIAFSGIDGDVAELTLQADAGYEVILNSIEMAGWFRADLTGTLRIYNGDYSTLLYELDPLQVNGDGPGNSGDHSTFAINVSAPEIHVQWGRDWNIGIDNVNFDQQAVVTGPTYCDGVSAIFCDDFERANLGADWSVGNEGGTAGISTQTAQSPTHSMFTSEDTVSVTSKAFDLSGYQSVDLSYWWRRGDDSFSENPEPNEDLEIEYLDSGGTWQTIESLPGSGINGEIGTTNFSLPPDALHSNFRIRFRQTRGSGNNFDYWHIDDVVLTGIATANQPFMMESGTVEANAGATTSISFQQTYPAPPAVFVLGDNNNPEPSAVRVSQVTTTGFTLFPAEAPSNYTDQPDPSTTVHYLVVSYGQHSFPDGTQLEVGKVAVSERQGSRISGTGWSSISFQTAFSAVPAVVSTLQTARNETQAPADNANPWITVAHSNLNANGVRVALERAETRNGSVTQAEDVAYLAIETGAIGAFPDNEGNTVLGEAQLTGNSVTGTVNCDTYSFLQSYTQPPLVVGAQLSRDGNNGGWLRRCSVTSSDVSLKIEEDWANDRDLNHITEQVGFLAFSQPFARDFTLRGVYALEGPSWDGTAGEVVERLGSGRNGQAVNGALSQPAKVCYGATLGGGSFLDIGHYDAYSFSDALTVMAWIKADAIPTSGLKTIVSKDENYEFHVNSQGEIYWWWNTDGGATRQFETTGYSISPDTWVHVAIVYSQTDAEQRIVVDGVTRASRAYSGESLRQNTDPLQVGADQGFSGREFEGQIDEVRLYNRALSDTEIQRELSRTRPCAAVLDHFEVTAPATASVCAPTQVTVRAKDAGNNTLTGYTGTVDLQTSAGHGNWAQGSASGTLSPQPDTDDDGQAQYSFVSGDSGEVVLDLANSRADELTVSVTDNTGGQTGNSAAIQFQENAIVLSVTDSFGDDIIAGRDHALQAEVLRRDPSTGECGPVTAYDGDIDLRAWLSRQADDPGGVAPSVAAGAGTLGSPPDSRPPSSNLTVNFNQGVAALTLGPSDVGHYALNLEDADSGLIVDASGNPLSVSGVSTALAVRPFGLALSVAGNPGASTSAGPVFQAAGQPFTVTARAVQYQPADDSDGDGQPDGHDDQVLSNNVDLSDNAVTASFDTGIDLSAYLVAGPSSPPPADPGLVGLAGLSGFSGGEASGSASYSEVGSIELAATFTGSYLGRSISLIGRSGAVGRFHPYQFLVSVPSVGSFADYCNGMNYTGQSFGFAAAPRVRFTPVAYAASGPKPVTQNYREGWRKLTLAGITRSDPAQDLNQTGAQGNPLTVTYTAGAPSLSGNDDGTVDYQPGADTVSYDRDANARIASFIAALELQLTAVSDGEAAVDASDLPVKIQPIGTDIRYGRLRLENAYGPETRDIEVPAEVQVWNGTAFERHVDESCWSYNTGNVNVTDQPPATSVNAQSGTANSGMLQDTAPLVLQAPGSGNTGEVTVTWPVNAYWRVDTDNDGAEDDDPLARVQFGVYRGHDRIIYWREKTN
ncbi:hypothetical protein QQM79_17765 [Marinobacteraceae bacterium S3BR75-40.1]